MIDQAIARDKEFNSQFDFKRIKDAYFRTKLEQGLIKYAPEDWTELDPIEENELGR